MSGEQPMRAIDPHIEKKIAPLMAKIRNLALRRGDGAFRDVTTVLLGGGGARGGKGGRGKGGGDLAVKMNPEEFKIQIAKFGIVLSTGECNLLLSAFRDAIGYLVVSDFVSHLKATLNAARAAIVDEAFAAMDPGRSGALSVSDMQGRYDASKHPHVIQGSAAVEDIMAQFLETFDSKSAPGGRVTWDEFRSYYAGISYGIQDDEYFTEMVRAAWNLYPRPPTPPTKICVVPAANATNGGRWSNTRAGSPDAPPVTKQIVGYTGHTAGAVEHFGESFNKTALAVPQLSRPKKRYVPEPGETPDSPLSLRVENKANRHNFRF